MNTLTKKQIDEMVKRRINEEEIFSEEERDKRYVVVASAFIWAKDDEEAKRKGEIVAKAMNSANETVGGVEWASMDELYERPWGMTQPRKVNI